MNIPRIAITVALSILLTTGCTPQQETGLPDARVATDHAHSPKIEDVANPFIQQKRVEYRDVMRELVEVNRERYMQGLDTIDQLIAAQVALSDAELAITSTKEERVAILQASLNKLKELEQYQEERIKVGAGRRDEMVKAKAGRIYGEILLLEETDRNE